MRYYNRLLDPSEIVELYNAGRGEDFANNQPPVFTQDPAISGSLVAGNTLTSTTGLASGDPAPTYLIEWESSPNGTSGWATTGVTGAVLVTVDPDDVGLYYRTKVTADNAYGSDIAYSTAYGPVVSSGPSFKPFWVNRRSRIY